MITFFRYNKILLSILSLLLYGSMAYSAENDGSIYAENSVLSTGDWYKIKTSSTGVYKLTYSDLKKIGLTNPQNVKIYGYGGAILDEDFSKPYIDDLPEVSIWMSNSKANFGEGDYILFYAQGHIKWSYDESLQQFVQEQNPYSFDAFYFVTESEDGAKTMDNIESLLVAGTPISVFNDYFLHEEELINIGKTGRVFYGENFNVQRIRNFDLPLEGITSDEAAIYYDFVSKSPLSSGTLAISLNNELIDSQHTAVTNEYYTFATDLNKTILTSKLKDENTLNLTYTRGSSSDINAYLNYIRVNYKRTLKPYGSVTLFRSTDISNALNFQISETSSSMLVFDVTDNFDAKLVDTNLQGSTMSFTADNSSIHEYVLVDKSQEIPTPTIVGKIENQNLHSSKVADMVIIVQPNLQTYAEQLAELHKEDSGLTCLIVNPEKIYNEFSSGNPDVTAYRRFMKMFFDRATSEDEKPKYLLLFGGGTYDNRFISNVWTEADKLNMLLTYQSKFSLVETASYVTDDYMGFLTNDQGANLEIAQLDLGIGRLPVRSEDEAKDVLEKIKSYLTNDNLGIWQNNITFVADDAVASSNSVILEKTHMSKSEELATYVSETYPNFTISKIYEDMYERVSGSNSSATYPDATEALLQKIDDGTLVLNYVGHGSTTSWTHENLLTLDEIKAMNNAKQALWITATCDFSRFDDVDESGGEVALFNKNGGAIALFSTVRVVYMSDNKIMNENIIHHVFEESDNKPARLGDILRNAKTESNLYDNLNKLKFLLLGDPALRLSYPGKTYTVDVSEINGLYPGEDDINIEGLSDVVIKGDIIDESGNVVTDFNGTLESIIFDVEQTLETRGNTANGTDENIAQEYTDYTNRLFAGKAEIRDGHFEISFVTPKDILDIEGHGKMNFFAYDVDKNREAQGSFLDYTVRGENPNAVPENNPPVISKMFLDNESFVSGGIVSSTPLFVAEISDDTGINLSNDGSHNISLLLDEKEEFDLTPFFANDDGGSKSGTVRYQMSTLANGKHTLQLTVWDVWNNVATETIEFVVASSDITTMDSFEIWGNPAREKTMFVFKSETPGSEVTIKMQVYSLNGAMVWNHEERSSANGLNQYIYEWDLNGNSGRLNPGVYICNVYITVDNQKVLNKSKKLIISNY